MLPQNKPDRIRILFDDHRLVANAGLLLPATLARHLGLRELVDHHLDLGGAPGYQHLAGAGGNGQQRVIAAGAGIAVMARSLLGQSIGLADGRVQIDGQERVAGSGPSGPGPGQQLAAHAVELTDIAPPETAQEGAQGGGSLSRETEHAGGPAGAQRIGVVDAISAG